jgi:hypothetical protein
LKKIQYVSKYIALSEEGLVPRLNCPMDQGLLLCNLSINEEIYFYCISCKYKQYLGNAMYDKIVDQVEKILNET